MEKFPLSDKYFVQEEKFLNALAEAYRLQEAIISATELSIISVTTEGIITSFNRAAENLLGYMADEVIGKVSPIVFHDLDEIIKRSEVLTQELGITIDPGFESLVAKARVKKVADRNEWTYVRKDGGRFAVTLSVTALWDDQDNLMGYAGIATDIREQKNRELKIKESESSLQALVTSLDDAVFELDENGIYLNVWARDKNYFTLPTSEMIGKSIASMFGEEIDKPFKELRQKVLTTGTPQSLEYKSLISNDPRWFSVKYSLIVDDTGVSEKKISASIRDITAQKKAEFSLKESEQKFRLLAENVPGVIYLCNNDANYSMLYLNDKVEEITGYSKQDFFSGKIHFPNLYHPEDTEKIVSIVDHALTNRTSFHLIYRIRHRSGEIRWMEEHGIGVYADQQLLLIEGFLSDITSRKSAEDELIRIADENYRVFNYGVSMNTIAGFDGYFKKLNPIWERILGWTIDELLSKPFIEFVHEDDREATLAVAQGLTHGKEVMSFENRYRCKDGSYRWLLWTSSSDPIRKIIYASAIDISERKNTEEELLDSKKSVESIVLKLQDQNKQLDEFAHIISHNLRSPVANIQALISFLNENSSREDYQLIFNKLKNVSKNLGETMNELMDTLQIKTNAQQEMVELRFKEVLDKVVQSLEGDLIHSGASVTYDFNKAPTIKYSKTYLESILQNLLSNAIKYRSLERAPEIHFETEIVNGRVELRVHDNGLGIDMEKYGHNLFGLHKTFHDHQEARGVGLFLTKTQIETLGGSISATSKVGKGTTFAIRF